MSDDRLDQERSYNERGINEGDETINLDVNVEELGDSGKKKKLLIVGGVAITVIVLVVSIGMYLKNKNSTTSEDAARVAKFESANDTTKDDGKVLDANADTSITLDDKKGDNTNEKAVVITDTDVKELRSYGYTGDEIEQAKKDGVSARYMINEAKKSINTKLKEQYQELKNTMLDTGSTDYNDLLNMTWLSGVKLSVKPENGGDEKSYSKYTTKENVRYKKVPAHGNQVFIQLQLKGFDPVYFNLTPQRYYSLDDEGNMVVTYTVYEFGSTKFITGLKEVSID